MTWAEEVKRLTVGMLRPPERLKISEWAHAHARIPEEGNAEPGRFTLARMPHQEEMLDDPLDPDAREIYWMMASQAAGKTLCLNIVTAYTAKVWRKAVLVVRATLDTAKEWMRDKLMPMVDVMPCMKGLLKDPREKGSGSTALKRKFPGGSLKVAGAKSPKTLRGSSQGKVYQDEIDSYEVTKEGDPCALADRAAITFADAVLLKCSTPTIVGFSRIDAGFKRGDQRYYFLPCCVCGQFQWLKDEQLKFSFTAEEYVRFSSPSPVLSDVTDRLSDVTDRPHPNPLPLGEGTQRQADQVQPNTKEFEGIVNGRTWQIGSFAIRDTARAIYVCEHCGHGWTDAQRLAAYFSGWRENPAVVVNEILPSRRIFKSQEEENEALGIQSERTKGMSCASSPRPSPPKEEREKSMSIFSSSDEAGKRDMGKDGDAVESVPTRSGGDADTAARRPYLQLRAHWRATAPASGIRSRHLNGMYLSIGKKKGMGNYLQQFAEDFLAAVRGGRETLMVWTNIFKTRAYEDPHQKVDWKALKERAEDYGYEWDRTAQAEGRPPQAVPTLPAQVVWVCFGADVQADRVEILFWGWGSGQESWALEWHVIYGDFDMPSTQKRVEEYLVNKRFKHPILGELPIKAGAIDSGHQTRVKAVYQFCARHTMQNWWAVKGFDNALGAVYQLAKEKVYGGKRFNLNVDYLKTLIFDRLKNEEPGPRYIHFPKEQVVLPIASSPRPSPPGEEREKTEQSGLSDVTDRPQPSLSGITDRPQPSLSGITDRPQPSLLGITDRPHPNPLPQEREPGKEREPDRQFQTIKTRFGDVFYAQLCSEKRIVVKKPKGGFEMQWVKLVSSARNEVLDMTVYAFGVFEICREEDWIERKWAEVKEKLREMNLLNASSPRPSPPGEEREKTQGEGGKTMMLEQPEEKKLPDVQAAGSNVHSPKPVEAAGARKKKRIRVKGPFGKWGGY